MNPILFIVALVLVIYFLSKTMFCRPKHFPPGPSLWFPYYGHYISILLNNYHHTHKALSKMCDYYRSKIFWGRIDQVISLLRVDFGEEKGIIFTAGDMWQQQKRFFLRHLRDYGFGKRSPNLEAELTAEIQDLITFLREEKDHPLYRNGEARIPTLFALGNINLLFQALTGERYKGQLADMTRLNDNLAKYAKDSMYKRIANFNEDNITCAVDAYIKDMKAAQENGDTETYFTEEQLKLVIQDFTFPASNTVSGQLGFLWQQFILHPEVQTKIQEEIDAVVGRNELPSLNHRKDFHYTEATIREIMRYKTLVPLSIPHRSTEDADFMGYHTEKGTVMITNLYKMHMDPDVWGDPENFRPERFLDEKGHLKKKDQTLPFGLGKRLCPGETFARQNMFMYVTGLLQNFTFSLPEGAKLPDDSDYIPGLNVHPRHMWLKVTPRL
ncbi:hypothetical protein WDU94_011598 [Cyamophila willieti]